MDINQQIKVCTFKNGFIPVCVFPPPPPPPSLTNPGTCKCGCMCMCGVTGICVVCACVCSYKHMCVLEYTVQCMEASINELYKSLALHALTHIHTHMPTVHACTLIPHTHTHTCPHTCTHTHTHTHTHSCPTITGQLP